MRRPLRLVAWGVLAAILLLLGALVASSCAAAQRESSDRREAAPPSGRFVHAADGDLFVQERGAPDAPVVLLVHGTGAWSETWRESMEALAAGGFRAVAIDLPPFGFSERPTSGGYSRREQGARIIGVLDALRVERAILVGHSFGSGPTVEAALLAPERVSALILVDAALSIREPGTEPAAPPLALRALLAIPPARDGLVAGLLTNPSMTRRLVQGFVHDPQSVTDQWVEVYQHPLRVRGTTRAVGEWLPALLAPDPRARSEDPASYAEILVPVIAIWGTQDTVTPVEQGHRLVSLVPAGRLFLLDGVGHIPQIEAPAAFRALLLEAATSAREP